MRSPFCQEQQGAALQALSVVLQHPALCRDSSIVCTVAQVCSSWRAAVQRSTAGLLTVRCSCERLGIKLGSALQTISSVASWIPKHPGLIEHLILGLPVQSSNAEIDMFSAAAEHLLADSIQQATLGTSACSGTAASSSPAFKLCTVTAIHIAQTALLNVLPVSSVTDLMLEVLPKHPHASKPAAWAAAVGRLTGLQKLTVGNAGEANLPVGFLAHAGNLLHLTRLEVDGFDVADDCLQQLPHSLQVLRLRSCCDESSADGSVFQLQHLTNLVRLYLDAEGDEMLTAAPVLPTQLQELNIDTETTLFGDSPCLPSISLWNLTALQQLTKLHICGNKHQSADIAPLAALPQLQQLKLMYNTTEATLAAAAAWSQVPQLCSLEVTWEQDNQDQALVTQQLGGLMRAVAAATGLTSLVLKLRALEGARLEVCHYLTGLTGLQELCLGKLGEPGALAKQDALHLSVLKRLTNLDFGRCPSGVGDMVAAALACHLTNLQSWNLAGCGLKTAAVVPVIAMHLKQLRSLHIQQNPHKFMDEELSMLSHVMLWGRRTCAHQAT